MVILEFIREVVDRVTDHVKLVSETVRTLMSEVKVMSQVRRLRPSTDDRGLTQWCLDIGYRP